MAGPTRLPKDQTQSLYVVRKINDEKLQQSKKLLPQPIIPYFKLTLLSFS